MNQGRSYTQLMVIIMCNRSLQCKSVCVYLNKSSGEVDQLAGNCYMVFVGEQLITQAFLFNQESFADQFYKAVEYLPEVFAVKFSVSI